MPPALVLPALQRGKDSRSRASLRSSAGGGAGGRVLSGRWCVAVSPVGRHRPVERSGPSGEPCRTNPGHGSGRGSPGAAPDLDALHAPIPEDLRERRRGGAGREHVVHDRDFSNVGRPPANGERPRDVRSTLGRVFRLRLRRRVAPRDADSRGRREAQRPANDGGELRGMIESAAEEAPPRDRQSNHRARRSEVGLTSHLPGKDPPERGGGGEVPAVLHAMDEAAQRRCEGPRRDHPVKGGGLIETGGARRGSGAGGRRGLRGSLGERRRAPRTGRAKEQRIESALAIGARVLGSSNLAAKAAGPRQDPVHHDPGRPLNPRLLQLRPRSATPPHATCFRHRAGPGAGRREAARAAPGSARPATGHRVPPPGASF